jgi:ubiquinone/menaquinone biosynthesis C-methylase UbiE
MQDPTKRFSNRVADYVRYRPDYPAEIAQVLVEQCGLGPSTTVADIGSGTGILSQLLLTYGASVIGVEPNREMREAGDVFLADHTRFRSVDGTAEATTLANASIDIITAGQAFHWFDRTATRQEFQRILKPQGWVALIWNVRHTNTSPFLNDYEELLKTFAIDYEKVNHKQVDSAVISEFFAPQPCQTYRFPHQQIVDFAGLRGRLESSSYTPTPSHPRYDQMIQQLTVLFEQHQHNNSVVLEYETIIYLAQL